MGEGNERNLVKRAMETSQQDLQMPLLKNAHFRSEAWHALSLLPNLEERKAGWTCVRLPSSAASVPQAAAPPLRPDLSHPRARPPSQQGPVITILRAISPSVFPFPWKSWQGSNLLGVEGTAVLGHWDAWSNVEHIISKGERTHVFSPVFHLFLTALEGRFLICQIQWQLIACSWAQELVWSLVSTFLEGGHCCSRKGGIVVQPTRETGSQTSHEDAG